MVKICYITTTPITVESFLYDTIKFLMESEKFEVTVISNFESYDLNKLPKGIKTYSIKMKRGIDILGLYHIYKIFKVLKKNKYDIVQYSTPNASLYSSVAAKLSKIKKRHYAQWGILYVKYSGYKRVLFKMLERLTCTLSTKVQPDSYGNRIFSTREGLYPLDKSEVIWNGSAAGINISKYDITQKDSWRSLVRENLNILVDDYVIGFIGRINEDKGINELVKSFLNLSLDYKNLKLILVGDVEKDFFKKNSRTAKEILDNVNIILYGYSNEIPKVLSSFDIFALPSHREGFGSVLLEAQAMEIPVVSTNIPGPSEALIDGHTGYLVECCKVEQLTKKIELLLGNEKLRKKFGINGRLFVMKSFNRDILLSKILENKLGVNSNEK